MATKVLVPLLGEGVEEVTVIKWLKKEGDSVKELEPLLEVNTDKVDTEIPAPASGTVLKIMAEEGLPAKVGAVLAFIGKAGESVDVSSSQVSSVTASKVESKVESQKSAQAPATFDMRPSTDLGFISPVVAKIAAEHGVNLQNVAGTGLNGRITKNDVLDYVEGRKSKVEEPALSLSKGQAAQPATFQPSNLQPGTLIKLSPIRKSIAEHMVMSKHTSRHIS